MADQVPPTRMALQTYKGKKGGASKGHQLLKKKADALKARFRDIAKEIYKTKGTMSESCSTAYFSLTAAQYAAGDFKTKVLEGNFVASVRVTGQTDNIAGVKIPVFRQFDTGAEHLENIGLAGGGPGRDDMVIMPGGHSGAAPRTPKPDRPKNLSAPPYMTTSASARS